MRRLYDGTIVLAEKLTTGVLEAILYLYKSAIVFMGLLLFGFFLVTMWSMIIGIPLMLVYIIVDGLGLL